MPASQNNEGIDRFLLLITWRRERVEPGDPESVWRGSVRRLTEGGQSPPPVWFGNLEDVGRIIRRLLPEMTMPQNGDFWQKPRRED